MHYHGILVLLYSTGLVLLNPTRHCLKNSLYDLENFTISTKIPSPPLHLNPNLPLLTKCRIPTPIQLTKHKTAIKKRPFFRNFGIICALAYLGTTISTIFIGLLMSLAGAVHLVPQMPILHHMIFGSIISATVRLYI